ncbi:hypothetical protein [Roseomonas chloroacetimidivorans]|uniref:hypothetical protein n=1 Tax=Roseomonas chloroacetimidivorans TaxID=1766656 RepID=UPI003C72F516
MSSTRKKSRPAAPTPAAVRLVHAPSTGDADGEPRLALEVPPQPDALSRRPMLLVFVSMTAALATKRALEGQR